MGDYGYYEIVLIEEVWPDGRRTWIALHPDLPGCNATGATPEEARANLDKSRDAWIAVAVEQGETLPEGSPDPLIQIQYSTIPGADRSRSAAAESILVELPSVAVAA